MKHAYTDPKNLRADTKALLDQITSTVEDFKEQGYVMTLRQLYYQLVARDIMANNDKQYHKLSRMLTDARMCGHVDWDVIEDRVRKPNTPAQWDSIRDILDAAVNQYRCDRHSEQANYVEVWVEKDALSGVLLPITRKYHLTLMVNRGYSSVSAMHDAALRFGAAEDAGKDTHLLYLGDHDPSGIDMIRDIGDRLESFGCQVNINAIALTMKQIETYNPPPNPAKITDPRAARYIQEHGQVSWELDALNPKTLNALLVKEIEELIDMDVYEDALKFENNVKDTTMEIIDEHVAD